jgi:hypothetical protein
LVLALQVNNLYNFLIARCGQTVVQNLAELIPMAAAGELAALFAGREIAL